MGRCMGPEYMGWRLKPSALMTLWAVISVFERLTLVRYR